MFNPFISNKSILVSYIGLWILIFLGHTSVLVYVADIPWYLSMPDSLAFNAMYFLIGISLWYPVKYISPEIYSPLKVISNHLFAALLTSAVWIGVSYLILDSVFSGSENYSEFLRLSLVYRFALGILFYFLISISSYLIIYYNNFKEKTLKEAELKTLVKEAELKTLKYQINPHFIFNSLNSICSLTLNDPLKANEMTIKLSSYLRSTLSRNDNLMLNLGRELENSRLYLDIEKIRFGDKFEFQANFSEVCKNVPVPAMILQPLFENAIKHGVYESLETVHINMTCKVLNGYLEIAVENETDPDAVPRKGEGVGLTNINSRLELIYGEKNLLKFSHNNNIFRVTISIPLTGEETNE